MSLGEQKIYMELMDENHTPYMEVSHGHCIGETKSGFVVLASDDEKILVRIRTGDDWFDLIAKDGALHETSEYRYIIKMITSFSRTLKACGYRAGQRNTRTIVVQDFQ